MMATKESFVCGGHNSHFSVCWSTFVHTGPLFPFIWLTSFLSNVNKQNDNDFYKLFPPPEFALGLDLAVKKITNLFLKYDLTCFFSFPHVLVPPMVYNTKSILKITLSSLFIPTLGPVHSFLEQLYTQFCSTFQSLFISIS